MEEEEEEYESGRIQIYTGDGKGKTTAALGAALRACGHGMDVYMIQFMKGDINYGELSASESIPNFKIVQFGRPTFVDKDNPSKEDIELAQLALEHARIIIEEGEYDMVILDELNVAIDFKLVEIEKVIEILDSKPEYVEIIITGRNAKKELIDKADLVTNMRKIKHYYDDGIGARTGFENLADIFMGIGSQYRENKQREYDREAQLEMLRFQLLNAAEEAKAQRDFEASESMKDRARQLENVRMQIKSAESEGEKNRIAEANMNMIDNAFRMLEEMKRGKTQKEIEQMLYLLVF